MALRPTPLRDVWERTSELSKRDRSLAATASVITSGALPQPKHTCQIGKANGLTENEIVKIITHLAFHAGWPKAMSAIAVVQPVFKT